MKKWGILLGGMILGLALNALAQTDMEQLFSSDNKNILYTNQAKNYTGSPLVYIEGISDKPQPKDWKDKLKIKLFGSMELPKQEVQKPLPPLEQKNVQNAVKIHPYFGKEKEVIFVPHTADWNFIIQVLNDEEIIVQEDIQFIKTKEVPSPIRDWPKQNLTLLEARLNGHMLPLNVQENKDTLQFQLPTLASGVHRLHLSYLIKKAGRFSSKSAQIALPLTDTGWNLPIDSLSGILLFPVNIKEINSSFVFGKNHKKIPDAFVVNKDASGALSFRATHLMPARTAIHMDLNLKYDSFIKKGLWRHMTESSGFVIFLVSLIVILGYLILNLIEIKITPISSTMVQKTTVPANVCKAFFKRTAEIWIGLILLWLGTIIVACWLKAPLSLFEIQILFLVPVAFVVVIDYLLLAPRQTKILLWQQQIDKEKK